MRHSSGGREGATIEWHLGVCGDLGIPPVQQIGRHIPVDPHVVHLEFGVVPADHWSEYCCRQCVLWPGLRSDTAHLRCALERSPPHAHREYVDRHQTEIGQLVWSHPSIQHGHYKNSQGKVFTLSPWPLDPYWEWTRHVERAADYAFG